MDKRATVIESIQKLIALGVSDKEIADNLYDVGIDQSEAMKLIGDARRVVESGGAPVDVQSPKNPVLKKTVESTKPEFDEPDVSMDEQIVKQIPIAKKSSESGLAIKGSNEAPVKSEIDIADKIMKDVADQSGEAMDDAGEFKEDIEEIPASEEKAVVSPEQKTNSSNNSTLTSDAKSSQPQSNNNDNKKSLAPQQKNIQAQTPKNQSSQSKNSQQQSSQSQTPQSQVSQSKNSQQQSSQNRKPQASQAPASSQIQESNSSQVSQSNVKQVSSNNNTKNKNDFNQNKSAGSRDVVPKMDFDAAVKFASAKSSGDFSSFNMSNSTSKDIQMSPDFEELWKKGIVVAVNAKLAEMRHLKEDVDSAVQERVDEAVRKELYQFKTLIDSQKDLIQSSNKESLDQKQKEITFIIDAKIAEIKQYNRQLSETLSAIENSKKQQELALSGIALALEGVKKMKNQIVVEMNSELIKSKSSAQAFIDSASVHLSQMDERINKTLELEKNIAEGMLNQAEQRIEQLTIQRADELIAELQVELNRLQAVSKKISPEALEQKINILEEFRKQFLAGMQASLTQINSAIDELNMKNAAADRVLQEKTLVIDAKIEELTKFEKDLTTRLEKK